MAEITVEIEETQEDVAVNVIEGVIVAIPTGDVTDPVLSNVSVSDVAATTANFNAQINEGGTIYWAVYPAADAAHLKSEVKTGTGAVAFGNIVTGGDIIETNAIAGLSGSTDYKVHYYAVDDAGNDTAVSLTAAFTTLANYSDPAKAVHTRIETVSGEALTTIEKDAIAELWDILNPYVTEFYFSGFASQNKAMGWNSKLITTVNGPLWSQLGYLLDGATQYFRGNFNPSVDPFDVNNHTIFGEITTYNGADSGECLIGAADGASADIEVRDIGPTGDIFFSGGKADALASTAHYAGDFIAGNRYYGQKSSGSNQRIFENGVLKNENTSTIVGGIPNKEFFFGAANSTAITNYLNGAIRMIGIGTGNLPVATVDAAYVQFLTRLGL